MRKIVSMCLTVALLAGTLCVMGVTLIKFGRNYAYGFFKSYTDYMPEDGDIFDNISARIQKLEYNVKNRLWGKTFLNHISTRIQLYQGKRIISLNGSDYVRLSSGGWYTLLNGELSTNNADNLIEISQKTGIDTAFVYCHCALFEDNLLPGNTYLLDNNTEFANLITSRLQEGGITVIDSRDTYTSHNFTMETATNSSDIHWKHALALAAAEDTVKALNASFNLGLDETALMAENFDEEVYPGLFEGYYSNKIGGSYVIKDDVHLLYPAYDTYITYEELNDPSVHREGSFKEAVVRYDALEISEETGLHSNAYYIYGSYLSQTHTHNENAADVSILVFKDSYGTPVSIFLGLAARDVYAVDLRSTNDDIETWIQRINPDVVVFAYSQQMLRDIEYEIAE